MKWLLRKLGLVRYSAVRGAVAEVDRAQLVECARRHQLRPIPSAWGVVVLIDKETGRSS